MDPSRHIHQSADFRRSTPGIPRQFKATIAVQDSQNGNIIRGVHVENSKIGKSESSHLLNAMGIVTLISGISFGAIYWTISHFNPKMNNMINLIGCKPHSPLVKVELELVSGGPGTEKIRVLVIEDVSSINYMDTHKFGPYKHEYHCGAYWPIRATFIFDDRSRHNAIMSIPNKPGHLVITYPINHFNWDELDDEKYFLELETDKAEYLTGFFRRMNAYK